MKSFESVVILGLGLVLFCNNQNAKAAPATGKINGVDWTFVSGKARQDGNNYNIYLWNQSFPDSCQEYSGSVFDVRMIFPAKVGSYNVDPNSWSQNVMVFGDKREAGSPNSNLIASSGQLEILTVTASEVTGRFSGELGWKDTSVSGDFTVKLCK